MLVIYRQPLPFFLSAGLGEGLAVGLGHLTYYSLKYRIKGLDTDKSLQKAPHYN